MLFDIKKIFTQKSEINLKKHDLKTSYQEFN